MKMFITRKDQENEYGIVKVPDRLVVDFERDHKDKICIKGDSIQDAIIQFSKMEKGTEYSFDSD